jgi:C_GCAxxG_C_C family probable redox protein
MKRVEEALSLFNEYNCSQSVAMAFRDLFELDENTLLKIMTAFGAGMGRSEETCGAVSGACAVIGLLYGHDRISGEEAKEKSYALYREFDRQFREIHETVNCSQLLGCGLVSEDGREKFKSENLKERVCKGCVCDAVTIIEGLIA